MLILVDFGAAAVLISFGAILGKCSLFQLWVLATIEIFFYTCNEAILMEVFHVSDIGGSMVIHVFGAFFGLSAAFFYQTKSAIKDERNLGSGSYLTNLIAFVGTLFIFCYWPSFNAALSATGSQQQRTVINTYLSISTSVISSIITCKLTKHGQLDIEVVLNATLAGGVAIGATADIMASPYGSMLVGLVAGTISALGYVYLTPFLKKAISLHDTCGVLNLHGMPGIIGGLTSSIIAALSRSNFGDNYSQYFAVVDRSSAEQAGHQLAGLALTLGIAISSGLLTGFITSRKVFLPPSSDKLFDDSVQWHECELEEERINNIILQKLKVLIRIFKNVLQGFREDVNQPKIICSKGLDIDEEDEDEDLDDENMKPKKLHTITRQDSSNIMNP